MICPVCMRKMLHHVSDGLQHGDLVTLRPDALDQPCGRHFTNDPYRLSHSGAEKFGQLAGCLAAACVEFRIALAMIRQPGHAGADPLAHIAGKMQHQIPDRVFVFGIARPDLLRRQPRQAVLDAAVQSGPACRPRT